MDANLLLLHCGSEPEPEPDTSIAGPPCCDSKSARHSPPSPSSSPSPKRSRRSVEKRVMSIPIQEVEGSRAKGTSECAPPSDSWAWRKYGQKPIKGSPYPRGYYRCSSSKGCPARKQVERSRVDPTMLVVTYSCEHNHPWPLPKSHKQQQHVAVAVVKEDPDPISESPPESTVSADPDESRFSDLIGEEMMPVEFCWFSDVGSTSSTSPVSDALLYCPIFDAPAAELAPEDCEKIGDEKSGGGDDVDDALFAGLGELPEYSVVFRRGYLERQMAAASW